MTLPQRASLSRRLKNRLDTQWSRIQNNDYRDLKPEDALSFAAAINSQIENAVALAETGAVYKAVEALRGLNETVLWGSGFELSDPSKGRIGKVFIDHPNLLAVRESLSHSRVNTHHPGDRGVLSVRIDQLVIFQKSDGKWTAVESGSEAETIPYVVAARWEELAVAIEELTHVVQNLKRQSGQSPFVSRLMSEPKTAYVIQTEAKRSTGSYRMDPDATEADAYARILELFGATRLPLGHENNYSTRRLVLRLISGPPP